MNPCVNAGTDTNHLKRKTTQLGPRLGWWCTTCLRARTRDRKAKVRQAHLTRFVGLSADDVARVRAAMPRNAKGVPVCPGCLRATGASKALAADHDHDLERQGFSPRDTFRGFLSSTCNQTIGKYSVAGLLRLVEYMMDPPGPRALGTPSPVLSTADTTLLTAIRVWLARTR
jgi:hypothetical protein